jgi:hypothetical protein
MNSVPPAAAGAADYSDDSSASEEIAVWGEGEEEPDLSTHRRLRVIKSSQDFLDAQQYLFTKKYGGPKTVEATKKILKTFVGKPAGQYFSDDRMEAFAELQAAFTATGLNQKNWTRHSMSSDLGIIFLLSKAEEKFRAAAARPIRKKHPLEKAIHDLREVCLAARSAYIRSKQADENRKAKIPKSLDWQKSGQLIQDSIQFIPRKADVNPCPNPECNHRNTMAVESQAVVNSSNSRRRAQANGGKFDGVSCRKACFCVKLPLANEPVSDDVRDCMCQIVFDEVDRCEIARSLRRNQQVQASKTPPPVNSAKASLGKYLEEAIKSARINQGQSVYPGHSKEEFEQDIATEAAHRLSSNHTLHANKNIRIELGGRISLQAQVQYRGVEGNESVKELSYKEAYGLQTTSKASKKSSLLGIASDVPDGSNFVRNKTKKLSSTALSTEQPAAKDPNRSRRNNLASQRLQPPVIDFNSDSPVIPSVPVVDPVRAIHTRLRKRCAKDLKNHRNKTATMTPRTHSKTRLIHTGLTSAQKDPFIKSVVADELDGEMDFPSSQDVLQGVKDTIETPHKSL